MALTVQAILIASPVRNALQQAWQDSQPGASGRHEEGGFILQGAEGELMIKHWPVGSQYAILVPSHSDCQIDGHPIIASFHTHPNTGSDFIQEPSETDRRSVRDDSNLKGSLYIGELVISQATIYLVTPAGQVREVADTRTLLA